MNTLEKIKKELEIFEEKKKSFIKELQKEFPLLFKEIFEKTDKIDSFSWTQYTPYFNDGDECTFSVHCDYPYINGVDIDDLDWYDWRIRYYLKGDEKYKNLLTENPKIDINSFKIVEEFKELINSIPDDFLISLFGDHVKVTITKKGDIITDYYEHD